MARKLAIQNSVKVPVKFTLNNSGKVAAFSYSVVCDRIDQDEIKARLNNQDEMISDFLAQIITGWEGQTLVVEEDGTPADFDAESLSLMLTTAGVSLAIFQSYMKECGAKTKN